MSTPTTEVLLKEASPRGWIANGKFTSDTEETLAGLFCVNRADTREVIAAAWKNEDRWLICRAVSSFELMRGGIESKRAS